MTNDKFELSNKDIDDKYWGERFNGLTFKWNKLPMNTIGYITFNNASLRRKKNGNFLKFLPVFEAYIFKSMRNQGYGKKLYRGALKEVKNLGYTGIASDRWSRNRNSNRIWRNTKTLIFKVDEEFDIMT